MIVWFATGNVHKKAELAAILNMPVFIPADAGLDFDPEETGDSFHENALLKARELHSLLNQRRPRAPDGSELFTPGDPIIADDSGLCVDALNGRPGIFSARYTGRCNDYFGRCNDYSGRCNDYSGSAGGSPPPPPLESSERNALLLEELGDTPLRTARFVCAMTLMLSPDRFFTAQETFEGEIVKNMESAQGTGGFGYDPILYIPALGRTAAELSEAEKNAISHRGKAGKIIADMLKLYQLNIPK